MGYLIPSAQTQSHSHASNTEQMGEREKQLKRRPGKIRTIHFKPTAGKRKHMNRHQGTGLQGPLPGQKAKYPRDLVTFSRHNSTRSYHHNCLREACSPLDEEQGSSSPGSGCISVLLGSREQASGSKFLEEP